MGRGAVKVSSGEVLAMPCEDPEGPLPALGVDRTGFALVLA